MADGALPLASWPSPCLGAGEVHVWRILLDDGHGTGAEKRSLPSHAVQARAQAHAALRRILAHYTGIHASALFIDADDLGKPRLRHADAPSFNLSHTRGLALVALSAGCAVGIDVERLRPLTDADALAQRFLTPSEAFAVSAVTPAGRDAAFLQTWTRKEAVLKASGHGLAIDTRHIEVGPGPGDWSVALGGVLGTTPYRVSTLALAPPWIGSVAVADAPGAKHSASPILRCHDLPEGAGRPSERSVT